MSELSIASNLVLPIFITHFPDPNRFNSSLMDQLFTFLGIIASNFTEFTPPMVFKYQISFFCTEYVELLVYCIAVEFFVIDVLANKNTLLRKCI